MREIKGVPGYAGAKTRQPNAEDVARELEWTFQLLPPRWKTAEAKSIRAVIEERDALRAEVARLRDWPPVVNLSADDVWELRCKR